MNKMDKLEAIRYHGFNEPVNTVWSWGTTRDDGTVLLFCPRSDMKAGAAPRTFRLWVAGASEGRAWHGADGNNEREQHVQAIAAGAAGYVMLYDQTFTAKGREKGSNYDDFLFRILQVETEADGKVFAVCQRVT